MLTELAYRQRPVRQQVKPDDHSEVVPLLPIPNRTVKRLCANDSAGSRVKVGHRQANMLLPSTQKWFGGFLLSGTQSSGIRQSRLCLCDCGLALRVCDVQGAQYPWSVGASNSWAVCRLPIETRLGKPGKCNGFNLRWG